MQNTKKIATYTLGCKVNQYETEAVLEQFLKNGYSVCDFNEKADVYIINTCTVTSLGDRKSRQSIRRVKKINPDSVLVVMGCYSQTATEAVAKIPEVDIIMGTNRRGEVFEKVESFIKKRARQNFVEDIFKVKSFEELSINHVENKSRAFLKVQDGCNRFCTYCIIPYARGNIRSRSLENSVKEAKRLADGGFSEIVLVGIHLASYGKDMKTFGLMDLITKICEIPNIKRVRLGSLEPLIFDEEFTKKCSELPKLCKQFHLSLQSGCTDTLKRMNRRYTADEYKSTVDKIRNYMPDAAITTDIMVGFPGETDEEFSQTMAFVEKIKLSDAHIFKYSQRKGTKAAEFPDQIDPKVKESRSKELIKLCTRLKKEYEAKFLDKTEDVLFEEKIKNDEYIGKNEHYVTVRVKSKIDLVGKIIPVKIIGKDDDGLFGNCE